MSNRVQELTGLRCVAVLMVVISHSEHMSAGGYTGFLAPLKLFDSGGLGVLIFFVLSGFLITNLLQSEWKATGKIRLIAFYSRRALRIWPAFYVYLATVSALAAVGLLDIEHRQLLYAAFHVWNYSQLFGLGSTNAAHPDGAWYLGHFWTLALEEQFYWFWPPLLIFILRRKSQLLLVCLILFVPLLRIFSYFAWPALRGQLEMMVHTGTDPILIGCFVALNKDQLMRILDSCRSSSLILTALILALFFLVPIAENKGGGYWTATYGRTIESAITGIVIAALTVRPDFWFSRMLRMKGFVFIGTISFSLYLWQQLFTNLSSPVTLRFPLCIIEAFVAATLSYWLIELPFLHLKDRLGKSKQRPDPGAIENGLDGLSR